MQRLERAGGMARPATRPDLADEVRALRAQNDRLREEVLWLRGQLAPVIMTPPEWAMSPTLSRLLVLLVHRPLVSRELIIASLYAAHGREEPETSGNLITVFISQLRRKLRPLGAEVHNRKRLGWYMPCADRERLRAQLLSDEA